jgi:phage terminase large subunit
MEQDGKFQLTDANTSPESILKKLLGNVKIVGQFDVETGIKKARMVLPRCYFDRGRTVRLRECLKRYRRSVPVSTGEPAKPLHDEYSHGADAYRYLAIVADKLVNDDSGFSRKITYPNLATV